VELEILREQKKPPTIYTGVPRNYFIKIHINQITNILDQFLTFLLFFLIFFFAAVNTSTAGFNV
jgi:hypothetical protein